MTSPGEGPLVTRWSMSPRFRRARVMRSSSCSAALIALLLWVGLRSGRTGPQEVTTKGRGRCRRSFADRSRERERRRGFRIGPGGGATDSQSRAGRRLHLVLSGRELSPSRDAWISSMAGAPSTVTPMLASRRKRARRAAASESAPAIAAVAGYACAAICGPTTVTSGIGCRAHGGGSTPAASAAMRAQWRSKPAGVQTSR
jgi:hypothetical protein